MWHQTDLIPSLIPDWVGGWGRNKRYGTRVLINTSPEPFSNWGASIGEDIAVFAGLWAALHHPIIFLVLLAIFIILMIWLLPKLFRAIKKVVRFFINLFAGKKEPELKPDPQPVTKPEPPTLPPNDQATV